MSSLLHRRELILNFASAIGYGVGLAAFILLATTESDRLLDSTAYWQAGRNFLDGRPLYGELQIDVPGAYFYAPLFAHLWAPFALLPEPVFSWLWRGFAFGCLVWLAGGMRNAGLWLLLPLTLHELANANVTLPVAAITFAALRGNAWLVPLATVLKFGPLLVVPYLWLARPTARRQLALGACLTAGACAISFAVSPHYWLDYAAHLGGQSSAASAGNGLITLLPTAAADFMLRVALAGTLVAAAVALRSDRLAFVAATIAAPTLWLTRLIPLLAVRRLPGGRPLADVIPAGWPRLRPRHT